MNLVKDYVDIVSSYTDAPELFIRASAYFIISSTLGKFFYCPYLVGHARPNLWIVLSSIPGRMRRSTITNYTIFTYKHAMMKFYQKSAEFAKEKGFALDLERFKNLIFSSFIEEGTPEGIIDHIQSTNLDAYCIISSEFGSLLERATTRDYEMGLLALFSKLYYGEGGVYYLSKRGKKNEEESVRIIPEGLYVTMFSSMQEPHLYLTPKMIRQGFLRRLMICYVEPNELKEWKPPFRLELKNVYDDLANLAEKIGEKVFEYSNYASTSRIIANIHPEVAERINRYAEKLDMMVKNIGDDVSIVKQTQWEHLAKLSILDAISKCNIKTLSNYPILHVDKENFVEALKFLRYVDEKMENIVAKIASYREPVKTSFEPIERVYAIIKQHGEITRAELYKKAMMKKRELDEILETLLSAERIDIKVQSTKGRHKLIYVCKE